MTTQSSPTTRRLKPVLSLLAGVAVGYAAFAWGFGPMVKGLDVKDPGVIAAAGVGLSYILMGLIVGLGALFPKTGAKVLNVAGREDLEDQRAVLLGGALCYLAFGAALILLALSGPVGQVPAGLAFGGLAGAFVLYCLVAWLQWHKYDELARQINLESSAIGFLIVLPTLILWGAAEYLGFAAGFSPLAMIALLAFSVVLGAFIAAGRRSLLTQG